MSKVSSSRMEALLRAESKLEALEAGGVDNWEFYGESLVGWHAENEREETLCELISELACCFGECAYEPSERGAGISFNDEAENSVKEILNRFNVYFKEQA